MDLISIAKIILLGAAFIVWPGVVGVVTLRLHQRFAGSLLVVLVLGLGFSLAIIAGSLAALAGIPPWMTAVGLLAILGLWSALLFRQRAVTIPVGSLAMRRRLTLAAVPGVALLLFLLVWGEYQINRQPEPHLGFNVDAWNYMIVIQDFIHDPEPMSVLENERFNSGNNRLYMNGWLYVQAMMTEVGGLDLIEFYLHWLPMLLFPLSLVSMVGFSHALRGGRFDLILIAAGAQVVFWLAMWNELYLLRLSEDKFTAAFILAPIALAIFLEAFEAEQDYALLAVAVLVSISSTLIHPLQLPALLTAFMPYVALRWLSARDVNLRWLLVFCTAVVLPILIITIVRVVLFERTSMSERLPDASTIVRASWWGKGHPQRFLLLQWQTYLALATLPLLLWYGWRRQKRVLYIVAASLSLGFFLYTWPGSALMGKLVSFVLLYRLAYYLPLGLASVWGGLILLRVVGARLPGTLQSERNRIVILAAAAVFFGAWLIAPPSKPRTLSAAPRALWAIFTQGQTHIHSDQVVTLGSHIAQARVFWPEAEIMARPGDLEETELSPESLAIYGFYETPTPASLDALVGVLPFDFIVTLPTDDFRHVLSEAGYVIVVNSGRYWLWQAP